MKIIKPYYEILTPITGDELKRIEIAGRTCYKSEDKITEDSAARFVRGLIKGGHEAMIEHSQLSVRFVVDRGVSHELVRHRLASFAQESTRYCNYNKSKFGKELTFIDPCFWDEESEVYTDWVCAMQEAENTYLKMVRNGYPPEQARTVLPNSIKTEVVMTANYREWRNFFKLRAARMTGPAHPQMEEIAVPLLCELSSKLPAVFEDIWLDTVNVKHLGDSVPVIPVEHKTIKLKPGYLLFNVDNFEKLREERGLAYKDFETGRNGCQISAKTIRRAILKNTATRETIEKLAKIMRVDFNDLVIA